MRDFCFKDYASVDIFYETLRENPFGMRESKEVREMLEGIIDQSINPNERLSRVKVAVEFFRYLSKQCWEGAEYPQSGIPQAIRELADSMA